MFNLDDALRQVSATSVLCIGDLMLDEFVYGDVSRVSPEAPAPVIAVRRSETIIGGAGNVARNIVSLGARCVFVGVVGDDDAGQAIARAFDAFNGAITPHLVADRSRPTTRKVRFVSEHYSTHLLRADWERAAPVTADIEDALIAQRQDGAAATPAPSCLSDYAKGVLTPRVIRAVIDAARAANKPVIVDPKAHDYAIYRGATIITPNRKELSDHTRRPVSTDCGDRRRRRRSCGDGRKRGGARHAERGRHVPPRGRRGAGPHSGLSGESPRRVGRGRHGRCDAGRLARVRD